MRVQMLGLCRFSYLGGRGFQVEHETLEQRRAFLYDPERLRRRWHWFETVTLPSFAAQTDPDFTLVVMTGPDLPDLYLRRLKEVQDAVPQAKLQVVQPMRFHLQACKHALAPHKEQKAGVIGHFRQDDDDAVAIDYIEDARRGFQFVKEAWSVNKCAAIDYMRGIVVKANERGITITPRMVYNAVAALTVYLAPEDERSATQLPHWRIGHYMPSLSLADKIMFCRFLHHDNDSGKIGPSYEYVDPPGDMRQALAERFLIDAAGLEEAARAFGLPPKVRD